MLERKMHDSWNPVWGLLENYKEEFFSTAYLMQHLF